MTTPPVMYRRNAHRFDYGNCEMCGKYARRIAEHCHQHGWIRGRACESCNQMLWHLERRATLAQLAAGACRHSHKNATAEAHCHAANQRRDARLVEWLRRCADCAATSSAE